MSDKVRKHKERASRLIAKGKFDDAIEEFAKAKKIDPRDLSVRQKMAETFARIGRKDEAVREYQSVAGSYAADGLLLKAIAINKVILSLDPRHTETQSALAQLYAKKRGDFGAKPVAMPKAMSAAIGKPGAKRSASEIRGVASNKIGTETSELTAPPEDSVIDLDADDASIEVVSVEEAGIEIEETPVSTPALGARVQTNLSDIMTLASQEAAPVPAGTPVVEGVNDDSLDVDLEIDIASMEGEPVVEEAPSVVVGTPVSELPPDEEVDLLADEGEFLELTEEAEIDVDSLPPIPLFSDLSSSAFIALTERMNLHSAEAGEILIAEGEYASSMYIVIQGKVKVVRELEGGNELKLAELSDGSFFGEMALLSDAPRTASVIAVEETMLFEISRDLMNDITTKHPSVEQVMKRFHRNRLLTNLLRTSPIFAPFSAQDKKDLIEKFKSRSVPEGKTLITKDKPGDGLYVLLSGRCEVLTDDAQGRSVVLAELKEGDVFGEMSVLWKRTTTASVRAVTPCIVLRLPRKNFDSLIMTHPQVLEALSALSEERDGFNKELLDSEDDVLQDFLV